MAVAFHKALDWVQHARLDLNSAAQTRGVAGLIGVMTLSVVGIQFAAWLVRRFAPAAGGSGIPQVKAVLQGRCSIRWRSLIVVKFLSGLTGIGAGLALGREGPTVQMGAAVGQALTPAAASRESERHLFVAAGAASGLSAAFNAPLSGLVFALEELRAHIGSSGFVVVALACLTADMICRLTLGQSPVFHVPPIPTPELSLLPLFLFLGIACGLLGIAFNKTLMYASSTLNTGTQFWFRPAWIAVWAITVAWVGWCVPDLTGSGQHFIDVVLGDGGIAASVIPAYLLIRFVLTIGSYATGAAGGIFSPILVLSALVGLGVGTVITEALPALDANPIVFAVVGMAAFFTGVVRAPVTGIVLIIEMTGNYDLVLPLFAACFGALLAADAAGDLPIYEALLQHDLDRAKNSASVR